jgi:hypothetical protein
VPLNCLVFEVLGWVSVKYFVTTADVKRAYVHDLFPPSLQERESHARRQMLEEERRRREEAEKRLQDETVHRQQLVDKEVKMRSKNFSQVSLRPNNKKNNKEYTV